MSPFVKRNRGILATTCFMHLAPQHKAGVWCLALTLLKLSVIIRQVEQKLFKSFLLSVTWKSKTRVTQDKSRIRRICGPVDSISADQFISRHTFKQACS